VRDLLLCPDKLRMELGKLLLQRNGRFGRLFKTCSQLRDCGVRGRRRVREKGRVLVLCRGELCLERGQFLRVFRRGLEQRRVGRGQVVVGRLERLREWSVVADVIGVRSTHSEFRAVRRRRGFCLGELLGVFSLTRAVRFNLLLQDLLSSAPREV
jgi:hypothetical protein